MSGKVISISIESHILLCSPLVSSVIKGFLIGRILTVYWLANDGPIRHVICDNASKNGTMLQEFVCCYKVKTGASFNVRHHQIRYVLRPLTTHIKLFCTDVAHIIMATQAVISTCSKAKYYSGDPEDDALPEDVGTGDWDEIGIIWAICMKVCVSSLFYPSFLMCGAGTLFLTTQAALQDPSRAPQYAALTNCC